jgi:CheY-like chemotaxis protein
VIEEVRQTDPMLAGRKVLVIDDDLRNIFALTSVLEQHGLKVIHAENGRAGIELLETTKDIDIVLLDIMMPDMDGYETTRAIRMNPEFATLPIVALTAKAMKGDREKCLLAGASDYVTKPVDLDHLFSVMRVWMARDADNRFEHGVISIPNWLADHDLVVDDDRNLIAAGDRVLLIVEDDVTFAKIMVDLAHKHGLKALIALRGATAMSLAREFRPGAITLDVRLPDMSGWTVLDYLKHDPVTRHIPVHVISGHENNRRGYVLGAMSCVQKAPGKEPLEEVFGMIEHSMQSRTRKLLLVTATDALRQEIHLFIGAPDVEFVDVWTAREALDAIGNEYLDGIVLDWVTSDSTGVQFIEDVQSRLAPFVPPLIVFGSRKLNQSQASELHRLSRISSVRYAPSLERLLDETMLLLHRSDDRLSDRQKRVLSDVRQYDPMLAGRKVLVIDDDLRNIFALTSVMEQRDLKVLHAENGRSGIEVLEKNKDVDIVLMDIMMPEMDGYETTRNIRSNPEFEALPIIALTAKAMKGDREKCLAAGASDYVTKPVDLDHLFSVMRVWLARLLERTETSARVTGD